MNTMQRAGAGGLRRAKAKLPDTGKQHLPLDLAAGTEVTCITRQTTTSPSRRKLHCSPNRQTGVWGFVNHSARKDKPINRHENDLIKDKVVRIPTLLQRDNSHYFTISR